jgi:hypothetical protein
MNTRDYPTLHLDVNKSKGTACSKKGYGCKWTWDTNKIVSHVHLHPYPVLLQAVPLLEFMSKCNGG